MKIAATHSYRTVPSIFTVAPKGSTKLLVQLDTLAFYSTQSKVIGNVANDAVEKADNKAGAMARYIRSGLIPAIKRNSNGIVMKK